MDDTSALRILERYKIKGGVIILMGDETELESQAINYLCSEWDYACMTENELKRIESP